MFLIVEFKPFHWDFPIISKIQFKVATPDKSWSNPERVIYILLIFVHTYLISVIIYWYLNFAFPFSYDQYLCASSRSTYLFMEEVFWSCKPETGLSLPESSLYTNTYRTLDLKSINIVLQATCFLMKYTIHWRRSTNLAWDKVYPNQSTHREARGRNSMHACTARNNPGLRKERNLLDSAQWQSSYNNVKFLPFIAGHSEEFFLWELWEKIRK